MASKSQPEPDRLSPRQEAVLKASKEVAVKFIESGRLSVAAFNETFPQIVQTIDEALTGKQPEPGKAEKKS